MASCKHGHSGQSSIRFYPKAPKHPRPCSAYAETIKISVPYDVDPDGSRVMMARIVRDEATVAEGLPDFVLVNNFGQALRESTSR